MLSQKTLYAERMSSDRLLHSLSATAPAITREYRSGIKGLDHLLGEGLSSGQTVEWVGPTSCGKTGALREVIRGVRRRGVAVAWIDTMHELMASDWADHLPGRLWVLRPRAREDAIFCAEVMLRTQSFGLIIVDGCPASRGNRDIRLQRLARQSGTGLVILRDTNSRAMRGRVHGRFHFESTVLDAEGPLGVRGPFSWSINAINTRTASPPRTQVLQLLESFEGRRVAADVSADRPAGRTRVGQRYGR